MINAPQGMATGLPAAPASSCAVTQAPPPLVGGGMPPTAVGVTFPSAPPLAGAPSTGATTATLGATTIGGAAAAPQGASFPTTNALPLLAPGVNTASSLPGPSSVIEAVTGGVTSVAPASASAPTAASAAAPQPLTTLAPGGNAQDAALVERTLGVLRQSASGAQIVDRLLAAGARVNVISDEEFRAMGHGDAHAFYDPKIDTMFLRRSDLADDANVRFAAVALAHEGTHLLDDVAKLSDPFVAQVSQQVAAAGGLETAQGAAIRDQSMFELTMIKETRAFLFAGQVARELGVTLPSTDPTSTAIAGANDQATYNAVWQRLLQSSYNREGRTATARNL